jgi:hypothetical protein
MRLALFMLAGLALNQGVQAQSSTAQFDWKEYDRRIRIIWDVEKRALNVKPRRRDEPLRDINISDNEIREIELLVRDYLPRVIVNIGPVVTGCPCEEGRGCTEQVYIQANTASNSVGLLLSRVANRWGISAAQKWWLRRQALDRTVAKLSWMERHEREWELAQDFPGCTPLAPTPEKISATSQAEPRK